MSDVDDVMSGGCHRPRSRTCSSSASTARSLVVRAFSSEHQREVQYQLASTDEIAAPVERLQGTSSCEGDDCHVALDVLSDVKRAVSEVFDCDPETSQRFFIARTAVELFDAVACVPQFGISQRQAEILIGAVFLPLVNLSRTSADVSALFRALWTVSNRMTADVHEGFATPALRDELFIPLAGLSSTNCSGAAEHLFRAMYNITRDSAAGAKTFTTPEIRDGVFLRLEVRTLDHVTVEWMLRAMNNLVEGTDEDVARRRNVFATSAIRDEFFGPLMHGKGTLVHLSRAIGNIVAGDDSDADARLDLFAAPLKSLVLETTDRAVQTVEVCPRAEPRRQHDANEQNTSDVERKELAATWLRSDPSLGLRVLLDKSRHAAPSIAAVRIVRALIEAGEETSPVAPAPAARSSSRESERRNSKIAPSPRSANLSLESLSNHLAFDFDATPPSAAENIAATLLEHFAPEVVGYARLCPRWTSLEDAPAHRNTDDPWGQIELTVHPDDDDDDDDDDTDDVCEYDDVSRQPAPPPLGSRSRTPHSDRSDPEAVIYGGARGVQVQDEDGVLGVDNGSETGAQDTASGWSSYDREMRDLLVHGSARRQNTPPRFDSDPDHDEAAHRSQPNSEHATDGGGFSDDSFGSYERAMDDYERAMEEFRRPFVHADVRSTTSTRPGAPVDLEIANEALRRHPTLRPTTAALHEPVRWGIYWAETAIGHNLMPREEAELVLRRPWFDPYSDDSDDTERSRGIGGDRLGRIGARLRR